MLPVIHVLEDRRLFSGVPSAANLVWEQQPSSTLAGHKIGPAIRIALEDAGGNLLAQDHEMVMLRFTYSNTMLVAEKPATHGMAVFRDLRITKAGSYQLYASVKGARPVASSIVTIMPGPAVRMHLDEWGFFSDEENSFDLQVLDRFGNVAIGDTSTVSASNVVLYLGTDPQWQLPVIAGHVTGYVIENSPFFPVIFVDSNPRVPRLTSPPWNQQIPPYR